MKFLDPLVLTPVTRLTKQHVFAMSDLPGSMMRLRPREITRSRTCSNHEKKMELAGIQSAQLKRSITYLF